MSRRAARRGGRATPARARPSTAVDDRATAALVAAMGAVFLALGLWAFVDPASFYARVAPFPPYHRHFLHDAGAFQIGLGATLLLALRWRDALFVAALGTGLGAALHLLSHLIDRDLGGRPAVDLPGLALLAGLLGVAALRRRGIPTRRGEEGDHAGA